MKKICYILFLMFFLLGAILGIKIQKIKNIPVIITEITTDTLYIRDTIRAPIKKPKTTIKNQKKDTIPVEKIINDSLAELKIPIEQKVYEDTLYTAYVSGYYPNLDSLFIYQTGKLVTNTVYVPKIEYKRPRFSIGLQIGYGTDFKSMQPYIGVGIQYNLFSW